MLSLLFFLIILSILIVVHEFGHFIIAKRAGVKVEVFSLGFGPKLFGVKKQDTEYIICAFPLGGYVKLAGDSWQEYKGNSDEFLQKPLWVRARILAAGSICNYLLAFLCLWVVFFIGYPMLTSKVGEPIKDMPAIQAGVEKDDLIMAVDGQRIKYWDDLQKIIQKKESSVLLTVLRKDKTLQIRVPVQKKGITGIWGDKNNVGVIGVIPTGEAERVRHGFAQSFFLGAQKLLELSFVTCKGIVWLLLRKMSVRESVTGPIGIFFITKGAISMGISAVLNMMAILSLSLSIFNLLPLPI